MDGVFAWLSAHGYGALYLLLALGVVGLPIPDETLLVFTGYLGIQRPGVYTFHLESDDGSQLYVGAPRASCSIRSISKPISRPALFGSRKMYGPPPSSSPPQRRTPRWRTSVKASI